MIVNITYIHKKFITNITLSFYGKYNFVLKYKCMKI